MSSKLKFVLAVKMINRTYTTGILYSLDLEADSLLTVSSFVL